MDNNIMEALYQEFMKAAHRAGNEHLMLCSSGNMSWRIGDKVMISGTGSWLPTIQKEKIAVLNFTYGTNGIALPSDMPYAVDLLEEEKVKENKFQILDNVKEIKDLTFYKLDRELPNADLVICFGGDGTILHMAKAATKRRKPATAIQPQAIAENSRSV